MDNKKLEYCHIETFNDLDIWYRNDEDRFSICTKKRFEELKRIVKILTDDDITINYNNYSIIGFDKKEHLEDKKRKYHYTCLCTEGSCSHLLIVKHLDSNTNIAVGSVCYERFHQSKKKEISQFKKTLCKVCSISLKNILHQKNICIDCLINQHPEKQFCLSCCKEIPKYIYKPRCMDCWRKTQRAYFIED